MTQFIFQDEITICLVEAVREFFVTNVFCRDWQWSVDRERTRITIVDSWPNEERSYPNITLSAIGGGSEEPLAFGQALEIVTKDGKDIGQYYGGRLTFDVNFQVASFDRRETHRISDLLTLGLAREIPLRVSRTSLHNLILETPYVKLSGEGQRPISDQTEEHTRVLSQRWQSYWKSEVLYAPEITAYLTTAERNKISGGTMIVQVKAEDD